MAKCKGNALARQSLTPETKRTETSLFVFLFWVGNVFSFTIAIWPVWFILSPVLVVRIEVIEFDDVCSRSLPILSISFRQLKLFPRSSYFSWALLEAVITGQVSLKSRSDTLTLFKNAKVVIYKSPPFDSSIRDHSEFFVVLLQLTIDLN